MKVKSRVLYIVALLLMSIIFLLVSCRAKQPTQSEAEEIIKAFATGNYEYVSTMYMYNSGDDSKTAFNTVDGQVIAKPYQQYEWSSDTSKNQGVIEQYWNTKDDKIVYYVKVKTSDDSEGSWMLVSDSAEKECDAYIKDNLSFEFDRKDEVMKKEVYVYAAEYEDVMDIGTSEIQTSVENIPDEIKIPYKVGVEYYIDTSQKEVVRIRLDQSDSGRAAAIANLMLTGMSQADAEKQVEEDGWVDDPEIVIDITNFNDDVKIIPPSDLKIS